MAYPIKPIVNPGTITERLRSEPATTGTNGGLHIKAADVMITVSASIFRKRARTTCRKRLTKTTNVM